MIQFKIEDGVAIVTIDRADKMNALTLAMRERLRDLFAEIRELRAARAVLLSAEGDRAFCTGADVAELAGNDTRRDFDHVTNPMTLNLHNVGKPVVCAVNGVAVGMGWSLALASDVVICAESARFSMVFRKIGLAPDCGASWFLPRLVGLARARELVMSARFVVAGEAQSLGLVQEVVSSASLRERSLSVARELAQGPTLAYARTKQLLALSLGPSLEDHLRLEGDLQCELTKSKDHLAALRAFVDKQTPQFAGH